MIEPYVERADTGTLWYCDYCAQRVFVEIGGKDNEWLFLCRKHAEELWDKLTAALVETQNGAEG